MYPDQPSLPHTSPVAQVSLTAYLHADGFPSHYEVEALGPAGNRVRFRAQGTQGLWEVDGSYVQSEAYFREVVAQALEELRGNYRPLDWPREAPPYE